jgi:ribosomal protein S18 acetylase RimI-like enzyme
MTIEIIILILLIVIILYYFLNNYKIEFFNHRGPSRVSEKDQEFLLQHFDKKAMKTFEKYYHIVNVHRLFKNNKIIAMVFDTNSKNIEEIPHISWNGLFLSHLCVDDEYRKQGVGTKMINKVINKAKQLNKDHVMLLVKAHNKKAINLYEKLDFRKHQKGMLMGGIEAIYYVKYL